MTVQDLINQKDFDYISWRVTHPKFSGGVWLGTCHSRNGELISNDGDYYSSNEEILSYEEWDDVEKGIKNGLDVLVEGKWM